MSSSKKIFGIVGFPVRHSFSPAMHNAAFRSRKIRASYKLFEKKPYEVEGFLANLKKCNISGLNVTIPYKEKVLAMIGEHVSKGAQVIGAVNTIAVTKDGRLKGFNTDYLGFSRHIIELKLKPRKVALIGAGGAARAVCFALAKKGASEVAIYDIDKFKSLNLAKRFRNLFPDCVFYAVAHIYELVIRKKDFLVNTTPVGMHENDPCLVSSEMLHAGLFVYDVIYNPPETKLLKLAKEKGLGCANGLGMLLYQGVEAFNIWMKPKKAPVEVMRRALEEVIKK